MATANQVISGKYRLERLLGSGGFASVWQARHVQIDRPVAIKILSDALAHRPDFVERFLREARLASRPIHETVCTVEDVGTTEEQVPYLVMEFLGGRPLSEELSVRGALPLEEVAGIGRLTLHGLAAAHAQGIVHRDIKPANLFLCDRGRPGPAVRILDFGLAKDLGEADGVTTTEQWMGTPDFFPPEYYGGEWREYGPEGDVFALGIVLFTALTGRRPLDGILSRGTRQSAFVDRANYYAANDSLPSPADVAPDVPLELDAVVTKAISVDPSLRYADASKMLGAWEEAILTLQTAGFLPALDPSASRPPAALLGLASPASGQVREASWTGGASQPQPAAEQDNSWYGPFVADSPAEPRRGYRAFWIALGVALVVCLGAVFGIRHLVASRGPARAPVTGATTRDFPSAAVPAEGTPASAAVLPAPAVAVGPDGGAGATAVLDFSSDGGGEEGTGADAGEDTAEVDPDETEGAPRRVRGKTGRGGRGRGRVRGPRTGRGRDRTDPAGDDYGGVDFGEMGRQQ